MEAVDGCSRSGAFGYEATVQERVATVDQGCYLGLALAWFSLIDELFRDINDVVPSTVVLEHGSFCPNESGAAHSRVQL